MITKVTTILCLATLGLCIFSCEKGDVADLLGSPGPVEVGHLITLELEVKHHYRSLPDCDVYLKKHTLEFPGTETNNYDMQSVSNINGFSQFKNLIYGDFYVYVEGYDQDVADSVKGYLPVVLDESTVQKTGDEYCGTFTVYVTE